MSPLLEVDDLTAGYDGVEVLRGLSMSVDEGSVVAVLGPNGVGKSTLMKVLAGLLPAWSGEVRIDGRRIDGRTPYQVARTGVLLVPEGRGVFPGLTVAENLEIGARAGSGGAKERAVRLDEVRQRFPRLAERSDQVAGTLSGGEQQMLAMSRAFLGSPRVLLLDEISMGLAPIVVEELFGAVADLRSSGHTIVLVEQYLTYALQHADHCYVLHKGRVEVEGPPDVVAGSEALTSSYLGG